MCAAAGYMICSYTPHGVDVNIYRIAYASQPTYTCDEYLHLNMAEWSVYAAAESDRDGAIAKLNKI